MRWHKRGHVYVPDGTRPWARKYASFPTVDVVGDVLRVYFSALDEQNVGRTGYVDLDASDPARILDVSSEPVLGAGEMGTFDDSGANAFSVVTHEGTKYLYYQGWQRTEQIPYLIFTGLATDRGTGGGFERYARTPVLDRTDDDPFLRGAPYVIKVAGGFRMWYVSCRRWLRDEHGLHYDVAIRRAVSDDGVRWTADERPCIVPESAGEYAVGRPSVLYEGGTYRMWYSIRSFDEPYRMGYAESADGIAWTRLDGEVGIERSADGWDSAMICYPHVVRVQDRLLMFYNGNQHGATGFGYAEAS
ncbi:MAG TPA: hypothetical protein VGC72_02620 [Candidatus Elarobacter sp.]|jgi:predicted GH43/DUF377 family glycosyl hydrolase